MRIALFRPLGLGSLLCAVPALRALDAAYPGAHITLIGLPRVRELAARLRRYLDGFAEFPGFPGMAEAECDLDAVPDFFHQMKSQSFDLAIQMHGSGEIANPLMVLMGAARNAGFLSPGAILPRLAALSAVAGRGRRGAKMAAPRRASRRAGERRLPGVSAPAAGLGRVARPGVR